MYNSKLITLLRSLRKRRREIGEFEKLVRSPFFTPKKEVLDLLLYIKKHWYASESVQQRMLEKEKVFKAIFPKEKAYKNWKMNECISDLSLLLEQFFVLKELRKRPIDQHFLLIDALKSRGLNQQYFKESERLYELLKASTAEEMGKNPTFYLNLMRINAHIFFHPNNQKYGELENRNRLQAMMDDLDRFFCLKKLHYRGEMYAREKVCGETYDLRLMEEVLESTKQLFINDLQVQAYWELLSLFQTGDEKLLPSAKESVLRLAKESQLANKTDLLVMLINATPNHTEDRLALYFELYQFALTNDLLTEGGHISPDHFNNIINLGCVLKMDDWVENFIEDYKGFLDDSTDRVENIQRLFTAYTCFYKQDFNETYRLLFNLKLEDVSYGLRYHTLLLYTLVEGRDVISFKFDFETKCKSFKNYLQRKYQKGYISERVRDRNLNFIKITTKINDRQRKGYDSKELLAELESYEEIPFRDWLEGKIFTND